VICDTFDVAVVPFPFVDKSAIKRRPALALSNKAFNAANGHTIFAMITTAKLDQWPDDHALSEPESTGLVADCYVRWKVFTLPNDLVLKALGALGDEDRKAISLAVSRIMPTV
jgi:mRNA interferase MazF